MTITAENGTQQQSGGNDARALVNAFTESLKQNGLVLQASSQQASPDEFQSALKDIATGSENPEAVKNLERLFVAHQNATSQKVRQELGSEFQNEMQKERWSQAVSVARAAVDAYLGDDADAGDYKRLLTEKVLQEFSSKHEADARAYVINGVKDDGLIKKIALDEVNKFNKLRGADKKAAKGPGGMTNDPAAPGKLSGGDSDGDESGSSEDPKSLAGRELEYYRACLGTAQRAGMGYDSKAARDHAMKQVQKFREGKRNAVEKMGSKRHHKD